MPSSPSGERALTQSHRDRLDPQHPRYHDILALHAAALAAGESGYCDPTTGLFVFTAAHLLRRGTCCDSGCRHCPYLEC